MAVQTTNNKPINPRGNDQSPKGFNRASLFSGKALDFDGVNDYVEVPYNADTRPTSQITLSAIVKLDDWNLSVFERVISCTEAGGWHIANGEGSYIPTQNTGMLIRLSSSGYVAVYVSNDILKNEYNHLTTTFDGRYLKMYVNGVLAATTDSGTTQTITYAVNNSIYIGAEAGGGSGTPSGNYIDGQISNAKVFDVALTAAQISDLYNNPEKIVPTGVSNDALKLWLPMMEGAGTTCYDGSGGGNHGTISGATWTHGIGAPVSQTAVIDWNKGTNLATFSEDFSDSDWIALTSTKVSTSETDPIGGSTAVNISWSNGGAAYLYQGIAQTGAHTVSMYVKSNGGGNDFRLFGDGVGQTSSNFTATNEWQRFDYSFTASGGSSWGIRGVSGQAADLLVAFAQLEATDSVGPYIPNHTGTSITSEVLLPQGLTSGRDITGVNLFENVRKQGALNLDGNSWAEVHDNASLDVTDAVSLEMWIYWEDQSAEKTILGKWVSGDNRAYALIATTTTGEIDFRQRISSSTYQLGISTLSSGWNHVVATHDHSANERIGYINGVQVSLSSSQGVNNESDNNITIGGHSVAQYTQPIAQPRIYNRALTAEEVQRNYDAHKSIYTNS